MGSGANLHTLVLTLGTDVMAVARLTAGGRALAFDLDGTIYLREQALPGAVELIDYLHRAGVPHVFATNNSSASGASYVARLNSMGIPAVRQQLLTSNDAAAGHLRASGVTRAYLVATEEVRAEYAAVGVYHDPESPQAVLLTFDTSIDYAKVVAAATLLRGGTPYFATHPDLVCPTPDGPIPDAGSFAALFEAATGRTPTVLGKPSRAMAEAIRQRLGAGRDTAPSITFVGDRLYTDVRMANENGFTAVLTLIGEATTADLAQSVYRADLVVSGLPELLDYLGSTAAT